MVMVLLMTYHICTGGMIRDVCLDNFSKESKKQNVKKVRGIMKSRLSFCSLVLMTNFIYVRLFVFSIS